MKQIKFKSYRQRNLLISDFNEETKSYKRYENVTIEMLRDALTFCIIVLEITIL